VYPSGEQLPGLVIYRFDSPIFFANAKYFRDRIMSMAEAEPRPTWIVVASEPITDVDTTAADMLEELDIKLNAMGINLVFAEMKSRVREKVERYDLTDTINPEHFFPTNTSAIRAYQAKTGATWQTGAETLSDGDDHDENTQLL